MKRKIGAQPRWALAGTMALLTTCGGAAAMDLNPGGEWQVRWDNTIKYSSGYRLLMSNEN